MAVVIVLTVAFWGYRQFMSHFGGDYSDDSQWPYKDLTSGNYSTGYDGIDISRHQGRIHWDVLRHNTNIQFVYIKATEGRKRRDPRYASNVKNAREAGFQVGSYHFLHKGSSGKEQFEHFNKVVDRDLQDLLPVVDVEDDGMRGLSRADIQKCLLEFLTAAKSCYGKSPIIYCNENFYNKYLSPEFDNYYLFIASYNHAPVLKGKPRYDIWQYSERGRVRGIWNWVDLCRFAKGRSVKDISF